MEYTLLLLSSLSNVCVKGTRGVKGEMAASYETCEIERDDRVQL